jgi:hypothetical protein
MPFATYSPVDESVIPMPPLIAKPIWLDAGRYKPVVVFPKKFKDGAVTAPGAKVAEVNELDVLLVVLNTLVPSQTTNAVCPCPTTTVEPPTAAVLNVSVNAPLVAFWREYSCTVDGNTTI